MLSIGGLEVRMVVTHDHGDSTSPDVAPSLELCHALPHTGHGGGVLVQAGGRSVLLYTRLSGRAADQSDVSIGTVSEIRGQ